ncbi:MAG: hypothetical protein KatS3mg023_3599 [Armatimonadota bacterium]|nr:MAG: hypothetical protein KatS3mg023_3599 [Armatimonadota bacterium]
MEIEAKNNYILVEDIGSVKRTAGGLYLPDRIDQEPRWFKVVQAGPGLPDMFGNIQRLDYQPGEYVYVFPHAVHQVNLKHYGPDYPDEQITFVSEGDVLVRSREPSSLQFQPVGSYCIIHKIQIPESRTAGGIYLPDQSVPPPSLAKVLAVGTGYRTAATGVFGLLAGMAGLDVSRLRELVKEHVPLSVQPGDTVLIVSTAPMKLSLEQFGMKEVYYIVGEADILAVLRSDE